MDYLGMLALGAFVGTLLVYGMQFIKDFTTFAKAPTVILAPALSGTVLLFIDRLKSGRAIGAYCVGLLVALMWSYAAVALRNIKSTHPSMRLLGWLHLTAAVLVSLTAAVLVLPPAFREAWSVPAQTLVAPTPAFQPAPAPASGPP